MPQLFRRWTEEEERTLLELKQLGKPAVIIAKKLNRTEASIVGKHGDLMRKFIQANLGSQTNEKAGDVSR